MPSEKKEWHIMLPNYTDAIVDSETLGIIVTLYAINRATWMYRNQNTIRVLIDKAEMLKNYAETLESKKVIFRAID